MGIEGERVALEQRDGEEAEEWLSGLPAPLEAEEPALPEPAPRPRGRPWPKGQSGNPAGRPPDIHPPGAVAEYVLGRKTIPLAKKVRDLALAGDRTMLKLWFHHVAQARRGGPDWPGLALVEDRAELRQLREAVTEGAITPAQADALVRLVNTVMGMM